jgi:hypothetical protein
LLCGAFGADATPEVEPHLETGWLDLLLSRCPPEVRVLHPAPTLALGCAWAFQEAVAIVCNRRPAQLDANAVIDLVTCAVEQVDSGWRGYIRTADGWLSLALGPHDLETWRHFQIAQPGAVARTPAVDLADEAQAWGLACVPVTPASVDGWSATAGGTLPRPHDPAAPLRLGAAQPLSGLRILDLGALVSTPLTCALLRTLGAEVRSIGHPARSASRWYGDVAEPVDFAVRDGQARLAELCRMADLVVDNFSPRVWPNFGFDPLALGARLHVAMPAFAAGDRRRYHRAYGFQTEALFGVGCVPGCRALECVRAPQVALMDHCVGFAAAVVCIGALASHQSDTLEVTHASVAALVSPSRTESVTSVRNGR